MRLAVACPHCGGEVTVRGHQGETVPLLAAGWDLVAAPQLPALAADIVQRCDDVVACLFESTARTLVATVGAVATADPLTVACDVATVAAPSWPGWLDAAGVGLVVHVGLDTFTAGATLMAAFADGLDPTVWAANVLVEHLNT